MIPTWAIIIWAICLLLLTLDAFNFKCFKKDRNVKPKKDFLKIFNDLLKEIEKIEKEEKNCLCPKCSAKRDAEKSPTADKIDIKIGDKFRWVGASGDKWLANEVYHIININYDKIFITTKDFGIYQELHKTAFITVSDIGGYFVKVEDESNINFKVGDKVKILSDAYVKLTNQTVVKEYGVKSAIGKYGVISFIPFSDELFVTDLPKKCYTKKNPIANVWSFKPDQLEKVDEKKPKEVEKAKFKLNDRVEIIGFPIGKKFGSTLGFKGTIHQIMGGDKFFVKIHFLPTTYEDWYYADALRLIESFESEDKESKRKKRKYFDFVEAIKLAKKGYKICSKDNLANIFWYENGEYHNYNGIVTAFQVRPQDKDYFIIE
jgi:transcription antitermination factor NusG